MRILPLELFSTLDLAKFRHGHRSVVNVENNRQTTVASLSYWPCAYM